MQVRGARNSQASRGFSLLELVVVIVLISVLITVALNRLLPLMDEAERVSVLTFESQLKNTLVLEAAKRVLRGEAETLLELEHSNPMHLLLEPPDNYAGEMRTNRSDLPGRRWYFDPDTRRLVYRLGEPYAMRRSSQNFADPEFEVRVIYQDRDADGVFDVTKDELFGVRLLRISGAGWLTQGRQY